MDENNLENLDSPNKEEENANSKNSEQPDNTNNDDKKAEHQNESYTQREKQYYERIKKLEEENKELSTKAQESEPKKVELSNMDILAIAKSDVHEEDIDRVTKFAQLEGVSIKESLAHPDMQAILERRAESRKVAEASNTGSAKSGGAERSPESVLNDMKAGKLPDVKDLEAAWDAETKK